MMGRNISMLVCTPEVYWCGGSTLLGHLTPLGVGELVLAHPDPPLHARGDGLARVGVERREAAQPARWRRGG